MAQINNQAIEIKLTPKGSLKHNLAFFNALISDLNIITEKYMLKYELIIFGTL